jgi:nucleoside-diphosphate-sugar epimerase
MRSRNKLAVAVIAASALFASSSPAFAATLDGSGATFAQPLIDACKVERDLGWRPAETFDTGIRKTIQWYLDHPVWIEGVVSGSYRDWLQKQYN